MLAGLRLLGNRIEGLPIQSGLPKHGEDLAGSTGDMRQRLIALVECPQVPRAQSARDFKESDRIRDELAAMGVVLKDSKDGTTWEIAR